MTFTKRCRELLWMSAAEKRFVGEIDRKKQLAEVSAAKEFWKDKDVQRQAAIVPPANQALEKIKSSIEYMQRQRVRNEKTMHRS